MTCLNSTKCSNEPTQPSIGFAEMEESHWHLPSWGGPRPRRWSDPSRWWTHQSLRRAVSANAMHACGAVDRRHHSLPPKARLYEKHAAVDIPPNLGDHDKHLA